MSRKANRLRAEQKTGKRQAEFARAVKLGRRARRADASEVIRATLRENPNTGKRHAARMMPARENSGARTKSDPRVELRTGQRMLSGHHIHIITTKNLPTEHTR